ncbi:PREDICTED: eukaryotic translation initiation factor 4E-binding protein 1 [Pygoscelis adeliae]|uniref:eukaryotic translation initiation factor 4E-binding protein 1 n=1 Tax=Pygoscelis adeliae TaxID=9238 RepID=UPI0004F506CC|nr:PREDICTED: eukaryotic translation initiation factor 4E-binding protein 1 [Pygoscelis adeliae]
MEPFAEGVEQLLEDASSRGNFTCKSILAPKQDACKVLDSSEGGAEGEGLHINLQHQAPPHPLMPSTALALSLGVPDSFILFFLADSVNCIWLSCKVAQNEQSTRIIYDRKFLMECRDSPVAKTPPSDLPDIPGVTSPNVEELKIENNHVQNCDEKVSAGEEEQFDMDI